ncbi:MAG: alpha-amylase, partial [Bacteroidales bacterium]|nr:alpha-amylase [Bacteroidales bacterium]
TAWDNDWINNIGWYTEDASGNIIHPAGTNWLDVADLNYNNENMRAAMIDAMKYWLLEANVDGYRCDYADGVPFDFWKQALDTLTAIPNRQFIFLAEGSRSNHFNAGFDLNYSWDFYNKLKNIFNGEIASGIFTTHNSEYSNIPDGKHKLRFTTNHDESAWDNTPIVLFNGKEGALAASVVTIFLGGVPLIYTGQEVGTVEKVPFFSNSLINWSENPDMLQTYEELFSVYSQSEVARGGINSNYPDTNVVCFNKKLNSNEMLIIVNIRDDTVDYKLPDDLQNTSWNNAFNDSIVALDTSLQLINYQFLILEN